MVEDPFKLSNPLVTDLHSCQEMSLQSGLVSDLQSVVLSVLHVYVFVISVSFTWVASKSYNLDF